MMYQRREAVIQKPIIVKVLNFTYLNETILFQVFKDDTPQAIFNRVRKLTLS